MDTIVEGSPYRRCAERSFEPEPASVGLARRFLTAQLVTWGGNALVDSSQLVVSELASNAYQHAGTVFTVVAEMLGDGALRLGVSDAVLDIPKQRPAGEDDLRGRGIVLVEALSRAWGVDLRGDGKTVWCELEPD